MSINITFPVQISSTNNWAIHSLNNTEINSRSVEDLILTLQIHRILEHHTITPDQYCWQKRLHNLRRYLSCIPRNRAINKNVFFLITYAESSYLRLLARTNHRFVMPIHFDSELGVDDVWRFIWNYEVWKRRIQLLDGACFERRFWVE